MQDWFKKARFGMFIHWGHCSQQGLELSWPMVGGVAALPGSQSVAIEKYNSTAPTFNPKEFDPKEWARLARRAGMRYAILTAKHHDGYALFHTKLSDFSIEHSPFRRDIVREFAEAFRAEGIHVGLYFSLLDWHHPDYPAVTEADKPYAFGGFRQPTPDQWERYVAFMFGQIRELLTNYGKIEVIWFDGGWERTADQWRAKELEKMIRELQPGILMNDRLPTVGDYETPEQFIPALPLKGPWETCMTINNSWGYNPGDKDLKSSTTLIQTLCEIAGKGGNLLLNVSPTGTGALPTEHLQRLGDIANWLEVNGEAILDTSAGVEPWQFYGPTTRRDGTTYLHLLMKPYETISLRGFPVDKVKRVRALGAGELKYHKRKSILDMLTNNPEAAGELIISVPENVLRTSATVIAVET